MAGCAGRAAQRVDGAAVIAWWWVCVSGAAGVFIGFVLAALLSANGRDYE